MKQKKLHRLLAMFLSLTICFTLIQPMDLTAYAASDDGTMEEELDAVVKLQAKIDALPSVKQVMAMSDEEKDALMEELGAILDQLDVFFEDGIIDLEQYEAMAVTIMELNDAMIEDTPMLMTEGTETVPNGYTTDENGIMAYKLISGTTVDIKSNYYHNDNYTWIQTTYNNNGYAIKKDDKLSSAEVTANPTIFNAGHYVKLSYTVTNTTENIIEGGKLAVYADTMIGDNDQAKIEVIKNAQGKVIGLKMVDAHENKSGCYSENAQFNLYFAGTGGVTNASAYWFGAYTSDYNKHAFEQLSAETVYPDEGTYADDYSSFSGDDSVITFSWQDISLAPGESKTFSCILGVGEAADPPQWSDGEGENAPVRLEMIAEATKENLLIHATAKVKDAAEVIDYLFYNVNGGEERQLGDSVVADGATMKDINGTIDMTGWQDGTYKFQFWVVNSKGVTSEAVERTITLTNGKVTGDVVLPTETAHRWETVWSGAGTHHWHECANPYCTITDNSQKDGYDTHTYQYTADDTADVITETCTICTMHTETASLKTDTSVPTIYTGSEIEAAKIEYSEGWKGGSLDITYQNNVNAGTATASCTIDEKTVSLEFTISNASLDAPSLAKTDETIKGKADGKITGLTTEMEYRKSGETAYTPVTNVNMTFATGTYEVRYKEKTNYNASNAVTMTIGEGRTLKVTLPANTVGYTVTTEESDDEVNYGESYTFKFELAAGYSKTDHFAVKVNDSSVTLNSEGQYTITSIKEDQTVTVTGVADITAPTIENISHNGIYCIATKFAVSDPYLDKVMVNDTVVTPTDGKYTITGDDTNPDFQVKALDKSGNESVYNIKVYKTHVFKEDAYTIIRQEENTIVKQASCDRGCGKTHTITIAGNDPVKEVEPSGGSLETFVAVKADTPPTTASGLTTEVVRKLLREDEKDEIEEGKALKVYLEVRKLDENDSNQLTSDDKAKTEAKAVTIKHLKKGIYLDLSMYVQIENQAARKIDRAETEDEINISISLPDELIAPAGKVRTYYVVRVHDYGTEGVKADVLNATLRGNELTFTTNKFSTYSIWYTEAEVSRPSGSSSGNNSFDNHESTYVGTYYPAQSAGTAATGDNAHIVALFGLLGIGAVGLLVIRKRKRA